MIIMAVDLSFGQQVYKDAIGIILTAIVAGVSVPAIKAMMDDKYFKKQKEYERQIRLQETLLATKMKLLEAASIAYWKFYFCCITMTYNADRDDLKLDDEYKKYEDGIWRVFFNIREVMSPAAYLLSPDEYRRIVGDFIQYLDGVDDEIEASSDDETFDWTALNLRLYRELASKINHALHDLATALSITSAELSSGPRDRKTV